MRLVGRKALVIGGNRGIGRAISLALGQEGSDVALTYAHHEGEGQSVAMDLRSLGRTAFPIHMNLDEASSVRDAAAYAIDKLGWLDILVNCAGIVTRKPFLEITDADFDITMGVNVRGLFICSQVVARHMAGRGTGRIVNVASTSYVRSAPRYSVYSASKGAVNSLTRGMAHDLAPFGINVNAVAPGLVETPATLPVFENSADLESRLTRIPLGRVAQPEDVAKVVIFLCSPESAYLTGTTVFVDGGATMGA